MKQAPGLKPILLSVLICIIFLFSYLLFFTHPLKIIKFKSITVNAQVADTNAQRRAGLSFKKALPLNQGMLFIFNREGYPAFWMKNMRFPLDLIWITADKKVAGFTLDATPCSDRCEVLKPPVPVKYVLEVNSGFIRANQINLGDPADF